MADSNHSNRLAAPVRAGRRSKKLDGDPSQVYNIMEYKEGRVTLISPGRSA